MAITVEDVRYIAQLAKLSLSENEEIEAARKLDTILTYMAKLNEIEWPQDKLQSVVDPPSNVLRQDVVVKRITTADAISNSPYSDNRFFRVPKVIH